MPPISRWSFRLADPESALPVATEHFVAAEQCLNARLLSHQEIGPDLRACACVGCAGDAIQKLAVEYNTNRLLKEGAPRSKDVQKQIEAVREGADALLKAVLGMDDYTRKVFAPYASFLDFPVYVGYFDNDADPPPHDSYSDFDSELVKNLVAICDAASVASADYQELRKAPALLDRGGATNLFMREHGSPDSNLVRDGWIVFETFQPGKASGTTTNGAFHDFLGHVYGYATGKDPENYSGLAVWVKTLAPLLRQRQDCLGEEIALQRETRALQAIDPERASASDLNARLTAVRQELDKIERAIQETRPGKRASIS